MRDDPQSVQRNITGFWNTVAPEYAARPGNVVPPGTDAYIAWSSAVRDAFPDTPCDVLDVGTGTSFLALIAAELGHRVTGIDLADGMLAVARSRAALAAG